MAILTSKTPCIETSARKDKFGYGIVWHNKKTWRHHRLVWTEHYGEIPKGLIVRHLCHNKSCVNIEHLAVGTNKDNRQDDVDAGKGYAGTNNPNSKLSQSQIKEIKAAKPKGRAPRGYRKALAQKYNVVGTTIATIWTS